MYTSNNETIMDSKTTLSISEARKKIFDIADDVQKTSRHYTLTDHGRPKAVVMSAEEFESWQETFEVMKDFPDLAKDIKEVERDIASGAYKNYATLDEVLAKDGYTLVHKKKSDGTISSTLQTARRKRSR